MAEQYLDESETYYRIPPHIWVGLKMFITKSGKPWVPDKKRDCLKKKLGARAGKTTEGKLNFFDIRMPGVEYVFNFTFFPVYGMQPSPENSGIRIQHNGPIEDAPWTDLVGQPKLDSMQQFAQQNGLELPEDWNDPDNLENFETILVDEHFRRTYGVFVEQFAERLFPILESCTDDALRTSIAKVESRVAAQSVGAEKGLPPLALEKYLGVPEPAKGSEAMKAYYKEHAARGTQGGRKKTRRQKKRRATRRR